MKLRNLAAALGLVSLLACASQPKHPECNTEYAGTLSHCPAPKPRPAETTKECASIGGVSIIEDGDFKGCVSPDQAREIIRKTLGLPGR